MPTFPVLKRSPKFYHTGSFHVCGSSCVYLVLAHGAATIPPQPLVDTLCMVAVHARQRPDCVAIVVFREAYAAPVVIASCLRAQVTIRQPCRWGSLPTSPQVQRTSAFSSSKGPISPCPLEDCESLLLWKLLVGRASITSWPTPRGTSPSILCNRMPPGTICSANKRPEHHRNCCS